jgi:hypothetical protein
MPASITAWIGGTIDTSVGLTDSARSKALLLWRLAQRSKLINNEATQRAYKNTLFSERLARGSQVPPISERKERHRLEGESVARADQVTCMR